MRTKYKKGVIMEIKTNNKQNLKIKSNEELHVVFGASGGVGNALVQTLVKQGKKVRGINRSGKANVPAEVEMVAADLLNLESSLSAVKGANYIYNCVNALYTKWHDIYPQVTYNFVEILKITGVKGIIVDNLYMYGEDLDKPLREDMDYKAQNKKGKIRSESARIYETAMERNEIQAVICRAPDFYGPGATWSSFYGERLFPNALKGKGVTLFGDLDQPHSIIYVFDFAKAITRLAVEEEAYGQVWHAPMDEALTQRQFVELIYELAGTKGKISTMPKIMIKILSPFIPVIREIKEMLYEFENPYLVDTTKFESKFGNGVTPHREAIQTTLEWYQKYYN